MTSTTEAYDVIPISRMRRAIGQRLREVTTTRPLVTLTARCDASSVERVRARPRCPSVTACVAWASARALGSHPLLNSCMVDGEIRAYRDVNLSIAVAVPNGLVAPVVRRADGLDVTALEAAMARLIGRARTRQLDVVDLTDGTFTVSNLGMYGIEFFTPIPNPPQVAILGVGAISHRLVMTPHGPVARAELPLSLTFDHAVVDGAQGGELLSSIGQWLMAIEGEPVGANDGKGPDVSHG